MRNLILFLTRYSSFFIFIVLEAFCFLVIYSTHDFHRASLFHSANLVSGNIIKTQYNIKQYLKLKAENDSLRTENAVLRSSHIDAFRSSNSTSDTVCTDDMNQIYSYVPAKVLQKSSTKFNNYFTLDKGSKHGIMPEMGVVGSNGIVGIVIDVSSNFSAVMSVLHSEAIISCMLKNKGYEGKISWSGPSPVLAELSGIPQHVILQKGDTVLTSGYSSIFPDNYIIGTIESFYLPAGSNFYNATVKLSTNFQDIQYVYIVNYLYKDERKFLESAYE